MASSIGKMASSISSDSGNKFVNPAAATAAAAAAAAAAAGSVSLGTFIKFMVV